MALKVSQTDTQSGPVIHRDVYPIVRVSTEFFLRGLDLLGQLQDDVVDGLIVLTLWHGELSRPDRKPIAVRELARKLDLPYETVRRHVRRLLQRHACHAEKDGLTIPPAMHRSAGSAGLLRKIYLNAIRMLGDLTRIQVVNFKTRKSLSPPRSGRLTEEQMIIAVAAIGLVLTATRVLRGFFGGDLMKGLVFTGIRAANVQHITNTAPTAYRSYVPDADRLPVTVLAISDSLRLPYETVRRHGDALVKEGKCVRIARQGLLVPETAFRQMTVESVAAHRLIMAFVTELRAAGIKL